MRVPTQRVSSTVVSLSSTDGKGDARKGLTVADGKQRRASIEGVLIRASNAKAVWMIEGIVKEDVWCPSSLDVRA